MIANYSIALTLIHQIGPVLARALVAHFGDEALIFAASKKQLMAVPGVGNATANLILTTDALDKARNQLLAMENKGIKLLYFKDAAYPKRLLQCNDAPLLLYYRGTANLNHSRVVSIVGSRTATAYGKAIVKQLVEVLANHDVLVVSGLAYGIDIAAHMAALANHMPTVGVLGHGLDRIYPPLHAPYATQMITNGGLLTEFPLGTNPDRENFPQRNRVIAGMSDVVVVVEASRKGGALITAELANSYNRDVYAFPGRITDVQSAGCNFLIKTNRAGLITNGNDLIYYLGWENASLKPQLQGALPFDLNEEENMIYKSLEAGPKAIDAIGYFTQFSQSVLSLVLVQMEMKGLIIALPGKVYKRAG